MLAVADAKATSAYLILNPAAGGTAGLMRSLIRVARERGIRLRVLEPGEEARHAAIEAADDGARTLVVAGGDGSVGGGGRGGRGARVAPGSGAHGHAQPLRPRPRVGPCAAATRPRCLRCRLARAACGRRMDQRPPVYQQRLAGRLRGDVGRPGVQARQAARGAVETPEPFLRPGPATCAPHHAARRGDRSRASPPWSSPTTPTSLPVGPGLAGATAWTPEHYRSPCWTPARSTNSNGYSRERCSAPWSSGRLCAIGRPSDSRRAFSARWCVRG